MRYGLTSALILFSPVLLMGTIGYVIELRERREDAARDRHPSRG